MYKRKDWKKDLFDHRDFLHSKRKKLKLLDVVDWFPFVPPVRDQGNEGSCVGHGIGGQLTGQTTKNGLPTGWFSPRWIYNGARAVEGTISEDSGAYPRDAYDWLIKKGCLLDSIWPYVAGKDTFVFPSSRFDTAAAKYPLLEYVRVDDGADGICSALQEGYFVSLGSPWCNNWDDTGVDGSMKEPGTFDSPGGGHETFLFSHNRVKKLFGLQNSWGKDWGNQGRGLLPFSALDWFKQWGGYDCYYVRINWSLEPVPPPPTPPEPPVPVPNTAAQRIAWAANLLVRLACPKSEIIARPKEV